MRNKKKETKPVMTIDLGACLTVSTKTAYRLLHELGESCRLGRNKAAKAWSAWTEIHNEWSPEPSLDKEGKPKFDEKGRPYHKNEIGPEMDGKTMSTWLYHKVRDVAPNISAQIASACKKDVVGKLRAKVPYNQSGQAHYTHEAIRLSEQSGLPSFRDISIPLPKQGVFGFAYKGHYCGQKPTKETKPLVEKCCKDGGAFVIITPFSKDAHCQKKTLVFRLELGDWPDRLKKRAEKVAKGELALCDSILRWDDRKRRRSKPRWVFDLCHSLPLEHEGELDPKQVAVLYALPPTKRHAFHAIFDPKDRPWNLGAANAVKTQAERMIQRRKMIQHKYKDGWQGGHGRQRFFRDFREPTRRVQGAYKRDRENMTKEIVRQCIQRGFGKVLYREPTLPLRDKLWFGHHGVPFNYTVFLASLKTKCEANSIELEVKRMGTAEHKEMFPDGE